MPRDDRPQQQALTGPPDAPYRHRYCRRCGRPLTAEASRLRGWGPDCDPTHQARHEPGRNIDQDTLPGT